LSEAVAVTVMAPETVALEAGEVMETVGGVVSAIGGLVELVSPAQAALSMANGRTSSHSLWVIVRAKWVTTSFENMIEASRFLISKKGWKNHFGTPGRPRSKLQERIALLKLVSGAVLVQWSRAGICGLQNKTRSSLVSKVSCGDLPMHHPSTTDAGN
jgi:hypothetical protein